MLRAVSLENFKPFASSQRIPLAPITLIYGPNSGGKSSIIQALLLLKQTIERGTPDAVFVSRIPDELDLGGFKDIVHKHDDKRPITIGLECDPVRMFPESWSSANGKPSPTDLPTLGGLSMAFARHPEDLRPVIQEYKLYVGDSWRPLASFQPKAKRAPDTDDSYMSIIAEENFEQPLYPCAADSPSETEYSLDYLDASHPIWALAVPVYKQWVKEARESLNEVVARGPDPQGPFVDREWQFDAPKFYREHYGDYSVTEIPHDEAVRFLRELRRAASQLPAHPTAENVVRLARPFHRAGILQSNGPFPVCFEHRAYGPRRKANYYELTGHSFEPPGRVVPSLFGIACAIGSTLRELLLTAYYLGPLRRSLSRHSFYSGIRSRDVGVDGGNVPELLHDNPDLLRNVNKWLLRLGLDGPIEIRTYPTVDAIFEMRLVGNRTPRDGVNVADVGFGVSQVLPLVVQSVSQENRLLLVEQPEIHLHPALQAELADLVISGIGPKRGNQYIIETHSEHLLLRLMRRIRETSAGKSERRELRVTADQVQVLYVERRRGHSIVRQMDLNANGELTKAWPGGFFEEGLREVL